MNRIFNIAGPCNPKKHYMIDALRRLGKDIFQLIDLEQYFVIHAARQSGKTTLLLELTRIVNKEGKYHALYCSLENAQAAADAAEGIPTIINSIQNALEGYDLPNARLFQKDININDHLNSLQMALTNYCRSLDKPLVLFFDEADCLSGQTLISFLRQLRNGYVNRENIPFIHSLALVGMRNIRDYRDEYRLPEKTLGSASPFNITAASMTLQNFSQKEVEDLYYQHTVETGQKFNLDAIDLVWMQTQGQPWLVNAIAREIVMNMTDDDPKRTITADMVSPAIQTLILRRDTHFDSLLARLREERVRSIIEPVLTGDIGELIIDSDDYSYVKDLGLIRDDLGKIEPANPISGDIIVRALNKTTQKEMESVMLSPSEIKDKARKLEVQNLKFRTFLKNRADDDELDAQSAPII